MMQTKIMMQLLILSIFIALVSVYGPLLIFSDFVLQSQFLLTFISFFALLSFFAYTHTNISNTLNELSSKEQQNLLPKSPDFNANFNLKQFFAFGDELSHFIRVRLMSQDKLVKDYNRTTNELKSHIIINQKFLHFAQLSIEMNSGDSVHETIQKEILSIMDSFNASSFYLTDDCSDLLRLDSTYGFDNEDFLLKSVPIVDFFSPMHSDDASIKIHEKITYAQVQHFITDFNRSEDSFDLVEVPIYIDQHLYGVLYFYNTNPEGGFSNQVHLLLQEYSAQAINAITNKILVKKTFFLSKYDSLTGLYNRSYFEHYFEDYNKHALRYKEHYSIVLIDLNRLKTINDKFGHIAGDKALQEFATFFKNTIRETDVLARFGGDEFIAIFHNSNLEQTEKRLEKIHQNFNHHHIRYGGFNIPIRFSYGVASSPDESMILNILVKIADERMYRLKEVLHKKERKDFDF